jgi:hypothetical protein
MERACCCKKRLLSVFFSLVLLFFGLQIGQAAELMLGPMEIHPYLQVSEGYEDNVFRCKNCGKEEDFYTLITPGVQLLLPQEPLRFQMEYRGDFAIYSDFQTENYEDNQISGELFLKLTPRLALSLGDRFLDGHDNRETSPLREIDFFTSNRADAEVGFSPNKDLELKAGYSHFNLDYADDMRNDFRDRSDQIFKGRARARVTSDTSLLLEYTFTKAVYNEQSQSGVGNLNNNTHQVSSGLSWTIPDGSHGRVTGGYVRKVFEDTAKADFGTAVFLVDLVYTLPTGTTIGLRGGREMKAPDRNGQPLYMTMGGAVDLSQELLPVLKGNLTASYGRESYFQGDLQGDPNACGRVRKDSTYRVRTGLDYQPLTWINAGIQYAFANTDSNCFSYQFDYIVHAVTAKVAFFY